MAAAGVHEGRGDRRVLAAFRLMGSTAVVTLALGVLTNKLIAVQAGLEGIALMGLYRTLGALVTRPLGLGYEAILVQRVSTARDDREAGEYLGLTAWLLAAQAAAALLIGAACAGPLAAWLFGPSEAGAHRLEVRIVVGMAFVNLALQMVTALLYGRVEVRRAAGLAVASSTASLVLIAPLLRLGRAGLALNVGSGSLVGVALGLYFVRRAYGPGPFFLGPRRAWGMFRGAIGSSAAMTVHPFLMMAAQLTVQSLVGRRYGTEGLGNYNAAVAVVDMCAVVLMSAVRSYYLPSLGRISDPARKREFMARVFALLLLATAAAAVASVAVARPLFLVLYSARFRGAADLFAVLGVSLVGQAMVWFYNSELIHRGRFAAVLGLDSLWAAAFVGGAYACTRWGLPPASVAWAFAASYLLSGALYAVVCQGTGGPAALGRVEFGVALVAASAVAAGCAVHRLDSRAADAVYLASCAAGLFAAARALRLGVSG